MAGLDVAVLLNPAIIVAAFGKIKCIWQVLVWQVLVIPATIVAASVKGCHTNRRIWQLLNGVTASHNGMAVFDVAAFGEATFYWCGRSDVADIAESCHNRGRFCFLPSLD